ncbi:sensor histidine kinase [Streptomyces sp. NPDC005485]|uniref:sensor histidine kinase n=1 Tax=Streptomyces sp. NPDC005485 TaxID=3155591 RepID=UPI0033B1BDF8
MTISLERYSGRHPRLADSAAALALLGFALLGAALSAPGAQQPHRIMPSALLSGLACLTLMWHRRHPRTVVVVTLGCAMAASVLGYLLNPLLLAPVMAAMYWLALHTDRRTTRLFLGGAVVTMTVTTVLADPGEHPLILRTIGPAFWILLPVVSGSAARLRHAYWEAVQARATYAERSREEEARLRVAEERMRIARELHDVVAHHMALANAQAGTAKHLARSHPEQAERILGTLADTTSSALRELKTTVGLLRQANDTDAPLEPAPGLVRLPELTAACRSAGVKVTVSTEGTVRPLSPGVDLTAFRIVQEALTNVTKHASAATVQVGLAYTHDRLTITVTDDGAGTTPAAPAPGHGFGLIGMRERAQSVGGDLRAGRRPDGGFEVMTALPLHTPTARSEEDPRT